MENITQATARDLLAEAMWRLEQAGLGIVGHVHDEVIIEVPEGSISVDEVCEIMNRNPTWSEGLVLNSAGYRGEKFYFKDYSTEIVTEVTKNVHRCMLKKRNWIQSKCPSIGYWSNYKINT